MADWSALTTGFTGGYEFGTKARRQRQAEKYNDMVLKEMRRGSYDRDISDAQTQGEIFNKTGQMMPRFQNNDEGFGDPYLLRATDWIKGKFGGKKKQALPLGPSPQSVADDIMLQEVKPNLKNDVPRPPFAGYSELQGDVEPEADGGLLGHADGGIPRYQEGGIPLTPEQIEQIEEMRLRRAPPGGGGNVAESARPPEQVFRGDIEPESARNPHASGNNPDQPRARSGTGQNPFTEEVPPSEEKMIDEQVRRQQAAEKAARAEMAAAEEAAGGGGARGMLRRGATAARGSGWTPAYLLAQAALIGTTPTEKFRKRFTGKELPEGDNTVAGDLGWRLAGGIDDLLLTIPSHVWKLFMDEHDPKFKGGGGEFRGHGASGTWGEPDKKAIPVDKDGKAELPTTLIAGKPTPLDVAELDVDYRDMPNMETEDWSKFRMYAMAHAGRMGMDPSAAYEYANDQVSRTQIKGFTHFAQQGLMLMEAGNNKAAMAAFYAAFQYFPNGRNVKFGMHEGKMYGIGYDEKTGKREGPPMLMDPAKLSTMIENFSNPKALREFTKDQQDFQQKLVEWHEKDKPKAQSDVDLQSAQAEQALAYADYLHGGGAQGGVGGVYKQADMARSQDRFEKIFMMGGITDQATLRALVRRAMEVKRRNLQLDETAIADELFLKATGKPLPQNRTAIPAGAAVAPGKDVTQAPVDDVRQPVAPPERVAPIDRGRPAYEQPAAAARPAGRHRTAEEWLHAQPGRENETYAVPHEDEDMLLPPVDDAWSRLTPEEQRAVASRPAVD